MAGKREPGQGSTFHFSVKGEVPAESEKDHAKLESLSSLVGISALIVDDNPTNRRILERTLLHWGMKPISVSSGWAAIAELRRAQLAGQPVPLVLLDAQMPQLDGFSTAAKVQQDVDLVNPKIVMLTSTAASAAIPSVAARWESWLTFPSPCARGSYAETILRVLGLGQNQEPHRQT